MSDTTTVTASESTPTPAAPTNGMSNADLLAEMSELGDEALAKGLPPDRSKPAVEEKDESEDKPDDATDADGEKEEEPAEDDADEETEEEEEETEPEEPPDKEAAKRIDAIQKAEKRSKEAIDEHRAKAEKEFLRQRAEFEAEWKPRVERSEKVQKLIDRAHVNPNALAEELGWDDDTKLYAAEQWFLEVKGKDDPKYKAQRAQREREREHSSKTTLLEKQLAETNARLERFEQERKDEVYIGSVVTAATDDTPHVRSLLKTLPNEVKSRVRLVRDELLRQTGAVPAPAEVLKILEENEAAYLKALGYEPRKAPTKTKTALEADTKTKTQDAGETKTAKTNSKNGKSKPPSKPLPDEPPTHEQLLKELEELERG